MGDEHLKREINRATQMNYQPGSIFKIVTSLACLESGLDPDETIFNPGHIQIGRRVIGDLAKPGSYNFRRGFIKSCNTYFISNGLQAGVEKLVGISQRLHLGERTGLPTGQEVPGNLPSQRRIRVGWTAGETANLCIGQGAIDVTPLQMAVMTAAIANGGKVLWPRLVSCLDPAEPHSGEPVVRFPAGRVRDELGVSTRTLQLIRDAMLADVEDKAEGTGKLAFIAGFRICGKTGTAQITDPQNKVIGNTLWFTSFAPYENPRYVVTNLGVDHWPARQLYEDLYCARGEMENRIKEQLSLFAGRVSTETMQANQVRLYFSAMAYELLHGLRRLGLKETELARAQATTIRLRLLKIGAQIHITARRVWFSLASSYPLQPLFAQVWTALRC